MGQMGPCKRGGYIFVYGKGNDNHHLRAGFSVHHRRVSVVEFVVIG